MILTRTISFSQYHINKLSIMSSDNHMNNSEKEVDEVDAALSDLEITLEGGKTSNTLVRQQLSQSLQEIPFGRRLQIPKLSRLGSAFDLLFLYCMMMTSSVIVDN